LFGTGSSKKANDRNILVHLNPVNTNQDNDLTTVPELLDTQFEKVVQDERYGVSLKSTEI